MEVRIYSRADVIKAVIAETNMQNNWAECFAYVEPLMQNTGTLLGAYWIVVCNTGNLPFSPLHVFCRLVQNKYETIRALYSWEDVINNVPHELVWCSAHFESVKSAIAKEN